MLGLLGPSKKGCLRTCTTYIYTYMCIYSLGLRGFPFSCLGFRVMVLGLGARASYGMGAHGA